MNQVLQNWRFKKNVIHSFSPPSPPFLFLRQDHIFKSCSKAIRVTFFSFLESRDSHLIKSLRGQGSKETPNIVRVRIALLGLLRGCQVVREKLFGLQLPWNGKTELWTAFIIRTTLLEEGGWKQLISGKMERKQSVEMSILNIQVPSTYFFLDSTHNET